MTASKKDPPVQMVSREAIAPILRAMLDLIDAAANAHPMQQMPHAWRGQHALVEKMIEGLENG